MSEIFRIEKRNDFTIVRNGLLRDKTMSLKAKGLLITMLSKPDGWDYTLNGLQTILLEGRDAIASGLTELERHGYLVRRKTRDRFGRFTDVEYIIYECPVMSEPDSAEPISAYVLLSLLTALRGSEWTLDDVQSDLEMLFERQYILTEDVRTETRYDEDGEAYEYTTVTVTLENFDLSHLPVYLLTEDKLSMYSLYMATLGNRPDLFPGYAPSTDASTDYEIPPEALEDEQFAAMMAEAEKYIGFPYVWGGSNPSTSFDCSGFVSWVVNNCGVGWSVGRLTAQGLYNICTPVSEAEAKPGDLVFFEYTYEGPWITHVGIYVGEGYILHAGNPIGYLKFMDSYYSDNFVGFGRLPAV